MNRRQRVQPQLGRWKLAALLALVAAPVLWLPALRGGAAITWVSVLAADALLAAGVLVVMHEARRQTFGWMAALVLPLFVAAVVLHNAEYAITGVEEPTLILVAILGGPVLLLAGLVGMLWTAVRDRHAPPSGDGATPHPV
jgi:hypothetical protein